MSYMYLNYYLINMMRLQEIPCIYALTCNHHNDTESRMRSVAEVGNTNRFYNNFTLSNSISCFCAIM